MLGVGVAILGFNYEAQDIGENLNRELQDQTVGPVELSNTSTRYCDHDVNQNLRF